jgi:malonyl-CoA O-methyltransferase
MEIVPTRAGYDRWAEFYDGDDNPLVLLEEIHIGDLIGDTAGITVADIGCGTGRHTLRLAASGARVTGVDFSEEMLRRASSKAAANGVRLVQHDLAQPLPLPHASFDLVLCCLVLDHISEIRTFFGELRRICRPRGAVVISVMHPAMSLRGVQARFVDPESGRRISPASVEHTMADYLTAAMSAGLVLKSISEHVPDAALLARSPRASKYAGWPMLLLMKFRPDAECTKRA